VADAERNEWMDGTTVIVAAISHDSIVVANAGDSRAVMGVVRQGMVEGEEVVTAVSLSKDQRPRDPEELKRIEAAGGVVVTRKGIPRVMGVLAVARAIGKFCMSRLVLGGWASSS
jgi:serine/threonine protein phosphatase PrpC